MTALPAVHRQLLDAAIAQAEKLKEEYRSEQPSGTNTARFWLWGTTCACRPAIPQRAEVVCLRNAGRQRDWQRLTWPRRARASCAQEPACCTGS